MLENPVLINPVTENPEDFFCYTWQHSSGRLVKIVGFDDEGRGTQTASALGLNRMSLIEQERPELLKSLLNLAKAMLVALGCNHTRAIDELREDIAFHTDRKRPLLAFRRFVFREMQLGPYVSTN